MQYPLGDLPENVRLGLGRFLDAAREACGDDLASAVLFGSAAEGRLRPSSDVNLILVLKAWRAPRIDALRESLRVAHAAIRLGVMFLLVEEIPAAAEAFAVKFSDILGRRRILLGHDPFAGLEISRDATLQRTRQSLMNLSLRLRERYALISLREEQLVPVIAEAAGPVRTAAAAILRLEGRSGTHPKESLQDLAGRLPGGPRTLILERISAAREYRDFGPGEAAAAMAELMDLVKAMQDHLKAMR